MDNQLNHQELQTLEAFIDSKNVPYLDVKIEVIDHFASAIEEMRIEDPNLTMESGMQKVFSKFPITGFALWQLEIEEKLKGVFLKNYFDLIKTFITPPKVVLTLALFIGLWLMYFVLNPLISVWFLLAISLLCTLYYEFTVKRKYKFIEFTEFKFVALKAYYERQGFFMGPLYLVLWFFYMLRTDLLEWTTSTSYSVVMALITTMVLITFHISQIEMPKALERMLHKRYPMMQKFTN